MRPARSRLRADEPRAFLCEPLYFRVQVIHSKRYMVKSCAAFFDEFGDGALRRGGLEQLQQAPLRLERSYLDLLRLDPFVFTLYGQTQKLVRETRLVQIFYGDAQMINR